MYDDVRSYKMTYKTLRDPVNSVQSNRRRASDSNTYYIDIKIIILFRYSARHCMFRDVCTSVLSLKIYIISVLKLLEVTTFDVVRS